MVLSTKSPTTATVETVPLSQFDQKRHLNTRTIWIISAITISSAAYGYAGAVIAITLTQPSFIAHMGLDTAPNASSLIGSITGLYYAGGAVGSLISGWLCNTRGRKFTVAVGNALVLISGALLTASVSPVMFIIFRFFNGAGAFMIGTSVPLWVAELAPPRIRGILVDVHTVLMMVGYAVACYVGLGFYFVKSSQAWRGPTAIQMVLPAVTLCGIYWLPESPRYLLSHGRTDEARKIVYSLHSDPHDPGDEFATQEFYQMQKQHDIEKKLALSYWEIFFVKSSMRKRAFMTILLEFCFMSSGILVVLNYGSIVWKSLGFSTLQILNLQGGFQLTGLFFNIVAMTFVDKVSRTRLIGYGLLITAAVLAVELALQRFYGDSDSKSGLIACAAFIFLFQTSFSLFLDGPTYFYIPEIWPSHVRSQGVAIAMVTLCLTCLLWLELAPMAFNQISWRFYLCFVTIPSLGGLIILHTFKNTLHKPLEEVAALFGDDDLVAVYLSQHN